MSKQSDDAVIEEFKSRIHVSLQAFCNAPKRTGKNLSADGFSEKSIDNLTAIDARDCLRAIEKGIVIDDGNGQFTVAQSKAKEQLFWEGKKTLPPEPRPIFLWLEPVITFAAMTRLHETYNWPKECLGMQTKDWKFDMAVHMPESKPTDPAYILGEVKTTIGQIDLMVECLLFFRFKDHEEFDSAFEVIRKSDSNLRTLNKDKLKNSHRKWCSLLANRPQLFWALGPGGYSRVFEVADAPQGNITLTEVSDDRLQCPFRV